MFIQETKRNGEKLKHPREILEIGDKFRLSKSAVIHNMKCPQHMRISPSIVKMPQRMQNRNKYRAGGGLK